MTPLLYAALLSLTVLALHPPILAVALVLWGRGRTARREVAAIILPGARVWPDGTLSAAMRRRVEGTLRAAAARPDIPVLVTGAGREAEVGGAALLEGGLAPHRLLQDHAAVNTAGNAAFAREQVGAVPVLIVTDDFHAARAAWLFQRQFPEVDVHVVSGPTFPWRNALREVAGWWKILLGLR